MSILAQLELNEASEVDFGIEIHGTTEASSEIRFIIEGPQYGILCKCTDNNGVITASIPKLKGILPAGTFDARLEVVVDGKFFTPLKESIEFKPMVEFDVTSAKAKPVQGLKVETKNIKVRVMQEPVPVAEVPTVVEAAPPVPAPVINKPPVEKKIVAPPVVHILPEDLEESWEQQIEQTPVEAPKPKAIVRPAPVKESVPKKKSVDTGRAKELYEKIVALKEQISGVKK